MSRTTSLTVSLPEALDAFVRDRVAAGRDTTASDVVQEALILLQRGTKQRQAVIEQICHEIEIGAKQAEAGELRDGKSVFDEIRRRRPSA